MFLLADNWIQILQNANHNGIVIFVSALLLTLSVYHFLLYFQHKDKAYLLYALYTFLVFVYTFYRADDFFLAKFAKPIVPYITFLSDPIKWLYTSIYILFAIVFIDLDTYFPQWNKYLRYFVAFSLLSITILTVISIVQNNTILTDHAYNFVYLPIVFPLSLVILYIIAKTDSPVKYYLLIGSGIFAIVTTYSHYLTYTGHPFRILFYFSIIFETSFFALGLGAKQRIILEEKNKAQLKVIKEHQINLQLQNKIKSKLHHEVAEKTKEIIRLNKINEEEQKRKIKNEYAKRTLDLRMKALQTQMNPHFLFNSLNSVKHYIIKNKKADASYFLSKLSRLLRKILDNSQLKEITLQEELEVMQLYLEVENMRLDNKINLNIKVDKSINTSNTFIPPLILQPFIENAIWHGLSLIKGVKNIIISINKNDSHLLIYIQDNGIGRERAAINKATKFIKRESLGIDLTKQRIEAYTEYLKKKVKITFEDLYDKDKPTGTKVIIKIPLI